MKTEKEIEERIKEMDKDKLGMCCPIELKAELKALKWVLEDSA